MAQHASGHAGPPAHHGPPPAGARRALSIPGRPRRLARDLRSAGLGRRAAGALALLLGGLLLFAIVASQVASDRPVVRLDEDVTHWLRDHAREPWTATMTAVTQLGGAPVLCAVTLVVAVVALRRGHRAAAAMVTAALAASQLATIGLKAAFDRPRPILDDPLATASWLSFPSGHASGAVAVYGTVAFLAARSVRRPAGRLLIAAGCLLLVALIAFTRVYLGVHHLTDVVAGLGVGCACLGAILLADAALAARRPPAPGGRISRTAGRS